MPLPPRVWRSVRSRVLVAATVLAAFSLALSGVVAYSLERNRLEQTAHRELLTQYEGAQMVANRGNDPVTGQRFESIHDSVSAVVATSQVVPYQAAIGIVDGRVIRTTAGRTGGALGDDTELIAEIESLSAGPTVTTITTAEDEYRVIAVDVFFDQEAGRVAFAVDVDMLHAGINATYGTYVVVALVCIGLAGLAAWVSIGQMLRPIHVIQSTVADISDTELEHRVPEIGNDDFTDLAHNINDMLDRLATTFDDQRAFYDDVSHELRTPLTVVRGHLELLDPDDPQEVRATRTRVVSELDRMNLLVDDMITLAKSQRPDFVRLQLTDISRLTDETFEKARGLGDRRWSLDDIADVEAMIDPRRIEQALLELCRNAVKFTTPGQLIAVGSDDHGKTVRIWVRDEGVGIAAEDIPTLTQRYFRAGKQPGREGQGLGLAIVDSIVRAHHGDLHISSHLGRGTRITLELPTTPGGKA